MLLSEYYSAFHFRFKAPERLFRVYIAYKANKISNESSCNHPLHQSSYWPWPPAVVYEATEEDRLIKSIAPLGQGEGHRYWPLWYGRWPLHLVQTAALDSCCSPTQRGKKPELRLSKVCIHAFLLLWVFVSMGLSVLNKRRRKREELKVEGDS